MTEPDVHLQRRTVMTGVRGLGEVASSPVIVEGCDIITTEVVERAVAERPAHDTIEAILEWLIGGAYIRWRTSGQTREIMITHEVADRAG
jgi:hypothetical protein